MDRFLEIEHRLTATEDREKANTRRIEKLEQLTEAIHTMSNTMVKLVEQTKTTNDNVEELKEKVDAMETEPLKNYKDLKQKVIVSIVTGAIGAILGAVIGLII